jgi:tRNA(fMet)-specific endonuclease VapC
MRRAVIDTNIYVAFKRNHQSTIDKIRRLDFIGMDITVLAELYAGFRGGTKEHQNRKELELFLNNPRVHLLNHEQETAEFYALIYHNLKSQGTPIPTNDIWIAASAMQHGLALLTLDEHFSKINNLFIEKVD